MDKNDYRNIIPLNKLPKKRDAKNCVSSIFNKIPDPIDCVSSQNHQ